MRLVRLGIACVNSTVGAVESNVNRAVALAEKLAADNVQLGAFPEMVIGGYPPEDLVLWPGFVAAQARALCRFAQKTRHLPTAFVLGVLLHSDDQVYNCAAFVHRGRILGIVPKEKLPLYNVFYETRTLSFGFPGLSRTIDFADIGAAEGPREPVPFGDLLFCCDFGKLALEVCEDMWSPDGPVRRRSYEGAEIVVNVSASPFRIGVHETRRELVSTRSSDHLAVLVYANAVGANDGLIFDGGGFISQNGRPVLDVPRFVEGSWAATLDLDRTRRLRSESTTWRTDHAAYHVANQHKKLVTWVAVPESTAGPQPLKFALSWPSPNVRNFFLPDSSPPPAPRTLFCEELLDAMTLGVGDYYEKTGTFQQLGVALSGGRDSLLCLLVAHRFITRRAERCGQAPGEAIAKLLRAFYMPTRFSSAKTREAAEVAASELGVPLSILSIDEAFSREAEAVAAMLQPGETVSPLTLQNIQSRLRAQRMWNWSNSVSGMWLQTGNMSEKAVGYTTIGGDLSGCLAPIANLPKTVVNYLLDYLLETQNLDGIRKTIAIPASAELAPGQEDERDLMPYPVLDACLALHVGERLTPAEVAEVLPGLFPEIPQPALAAWAEKFGRLFMLSIYKWVQSPLSLHLGNLDIERERALQLPVVSRREWQNS
jgi:NAD+ synthase (glutamine-hydrolysing)